MTNTTTVTVLFTDVVGNAALRQRLGDAAAERALQEHNRLVREQIGTHGGREVNLVRRVGAALPFPCARPALGA